jgi:hypothetical protein
MSGSVRWPIPQRQAGTPLARIISPPIAGAAAHTLQIDDTCAVTDAFAKAVTHPLTEAPTVTDAISKKPGKGIADTA